MAILDNIIIGTPLVNVESLGVLPSENTVSFTFKEVQNDKGQLFLPTILMKAGLFGSTSEIRRVNNQRQKSDKFKNDPDMNLWRNITSPEMTLFKIGKKVFWLIVGDE